MYDINNKVILNMSNDISNSTSQYKILYSNYGYVKVDESLLSTNAIIPFEQISSQITGTINKTSLYSENSYKNKNTLR